MKQVTLGHEDIEWFYDDRPDIKHNIFRDDYFEDFVKSVGVKSALHSAHWFHRLIANQLISKAVMTTETSWGHYTIKLCQTARYRKQQMRRQYVEVYGQEAATAEFARLNALYPRAIWGERL